MLIVGALAAGSLAGVVWLRHPPSSQTSASATAGSGHAIDDAKEEPAVVRQDVVDIFAVRTWEPPPPPPGSQPSAVALAPPEPQVPALPFRLLGRIEDPGKSDTFLFAYADSVRSASVGQDVDKNYRLEKFENGQLYFLYRPLNRHQTLSVGSRP